MMDGNKFVCDKCKCTQFFVLPRGCNIVCSECKTMYYVKDDGMELILTMRGEER